MLTVMVLILQPVLFSSKTHYGKDRQMLYSGTLSHVHTSIPIVSVFTGAVSMLCREARCAVG